MFKFKKNFKIGFSEISWKTIKIYKIVINILCIDVKNYILYSQSQNSTTQLTYTHFGILF